MSQPITLRIIEMSLISTIVLLAISIQGLTPQIIHSTDWEFPINTVPISGTAEVSATLLNDTTLDFYIVYQYNGYLILGVSYGNFTENADVFFVRFRPANDPQNPTGIDGLYFQSCTWQSDGTLTDCKSQDEGGLWKVVRVQIHSYTKTWKAQIQRNFAEQSDYPWGLDVPFWVQEYTMLFDRPSDFSTNPLVNQVAGKARLGTSWLLSSLVGLVLGALWISC